MTTDAAKRILEMEFRGNRFLSDLRFQREPILIRSLNFRNGVQREPILIGSFNFRRTDSHRISSLEHSIAVNEDLDRL